jgi:hypothetical protein
MEAAWVQGFTFGLTYIRSSNLGALYARFVQCMARLIKVRIKTGIGRSHAEGVGVGGLKGWISQDIKFSLIAIDISL